MNVPRTCLLARAFAAVAASCDAVADALEERFT